jgi:hypothetical protein
MARELTEAIDIDGTHLLHQDSGLGAFDSDFGPKGRSPGTGRRRRHQDDGPGEQGVGLNDHAIAFALLFVTAAFGKPKLEDVTPPHEGSP